MAQDRSTRGVASLRDALATTDRPSLSFTNAGSAENSGLARLAELEPLDVGLSEAIAALDCSPMFWLAVAGYRAAMRDVLRTEPQDAATREETALTALCARMFLAGQLAVVQQGGRA